MYENELAKIVFEAGLTVHRALGPGLLESAYEECLYYELYCLNLKVEKQKPLSQTEAVQPAGIETDSLRQ